MLYFVFFTLEFAAVWVQHLLNELFITGLVLLLVSNFLPPIYILNVHRQIFSEALKGIVEADDKETKDSKSEVYFDTIVIKNSFFVLDA